MLYIQRVNCEMDGWIVVLVRIIHVELPDQENLLAGDDCRRKS